MSQIMRSGAFQRPANTDPYEFTDEAAWRLVGDDAALAQAVEIREVVRAVGDSFVVDRVSVRKSGPDVIGYPGSFYVYLFEDKPEVLIGDGGVAVSTPDPQHRSISAVADTRSLVYIGNCSDQYSSAGGCVAFDGGFEIGSNKIITPRRNGSAWALVVLHGSLNTSYTPASEEKFEVVVEGWRP